MIETFSCRDFEDLPSEVQASTRVFLDNVDSASPYQDPLFCGVDGFGEGVDRGVVVVRRELSTVFFAYCVQNYAASRYLPRLRNLYLPKGPVVQEASALKAGLSALDGLSRSKGFVKTYIEPQLEAGATGWYDGILAGPHWESGDTSTDATLRLDLSPSVDQLLSKLQKTTRYELKRAGRTGVTARRAETAAEFGAFYEIYRRRGRKKGFPTVEPNVFESLRRRVLAEPARGALFVSELRRTIVGGVLVLRAGPRVHYVYGASDTEAAAGLPIAYPAIWAAIAWARSIGCRDFDFGGFGPGGAEGVRNFKSGFGGRRIGFVPAKRRSYRPAVNAVIRLTRLLVR